MTASLLSKKDQTLTDYGKVMKLRRIARRAMCKADWYRELAARTAANLADPNFWTAEEEALGWRADATAEMLRLQRDAVPLDARAKRAADEILAICAQTDDLDLRRRTRAFR